MNSTTRFRVNGQDARAAGTVVVSANTSPAENQPGWMFNRDPGNTAPYAFNNAAASIGVGSLNVLPIGANPADKFIGEFFMLSPLANVQSISYDFKIGAGGNAGSAVQFYMNVYANFGASSPTKFYDCSTTLCRQQDRPPSSRRSRSTPARPIQ